MSENDMSTACCSAVDGVPKNDETAPETAAVDDTITRSGSIGRSGAISNEKDHSAVTANGRRRATPHVDKDANGPPTVNVTRVVPLTDRSAATVGGEMLALRARVPLIIAAAARRTLPNEVVTVTAAAGGSSTMPARNGNMTVMGHSSASSIGTAAFTHVVLPQVPTSGGPLRAARSVLFSLLELNFWAMLSMHTAGLLVVEVGRVVFASTVGALVFAAAAVPVETITDGWSDEG
jgi:hypothetical protein